MGLLNPVFCSQEQVLGGHKPSRKPGLCFIPHISLFVPAQALRDAPLASRGSGAILLPVIPVASSQTMCKGRGDVWTGSTGVKDSDGKAGGCRGSREEHDFIGMCRTGELLGDVNHSAWANGFPDEGNNSQGRIFWLNFAVTLRCRWDVCACKAQCSTGGVNLFWWRMFWQLAVGLGHFFLWEQEFKQAGAPGGWDRRSTWLQADWLCFCFPQHPVLGQPPSLLLSSVLS